MQSLKRAQEDKPKTQVLHLKSRSCLTLRVRTEKQTMNSLLIPSTTSILHPQPLSFFFHQSSPPRGLHFQHNHRLSSSSLQSLTTTTVKCTQPEGTVAVLNFEELAEKDFSFLDTDNFNTPEQKTQKSNRIISSGDIKETSRVLVSLSSEGFVDLLVESYPSELLLVVHDSLFVLAGIKEMYDDVKCWQGEIICVPEKWSPFDVVFLYYLPGMTFQLDQIFGAIAQRCSTGARLVISHPQGKEYVQQQRKDYPDVVVSDLPDKMTLEKVAADHSFEISEYVDEPGFYLAVLKFCGEGPSAK